LAVVLFLVWLLWHERGPVRMPEQRLPETKLPVEVVSVATWATQAPSTSVERRAAA
jgi:hypothetical protein